VRLSIRQWLDVRLPTEELCIVARRRTSSCLLLTYLNLGRLDISRLPSSLSRSKHGRYAQRSEKIMNVCLERKTSRLKECKNAQKRVYRYGQRTESSTKSQEQKGGSLFTIARSFETRSMRLRSSGRPLRLPRCPPPLGTKKPFSLAKVGGAACLSRFQP
jgi:hypothetical protein